MSNNHKFVVSIGYTKLAFDDKETAMRLYALLTESTPVTNVYCYGAGEKAPESLKDVSFAREESNVEIELKRYPANNFALHLTETEYKARCKAQPAEVDGEARLIEEEQVAALEGPARDDVADVEFL